MSDPTEEIRRAMIPYTHDDLEVTRELGQPTWTTEELSRDFEVQGFMAPFVVVRRRSDGVRGSLEFTHSPRVYFNFQEDK